MNCTRCGRVIQAGADKCEACGLALAGSAGAPPSREGATLTFIPGENPTESIGPLSHPAGDGTVRKNFPPGHRLGKRYEIVAVLGEGGMGTVYEAVDHDLQRRVALKVIRNEMTSQPEVLERFKREILLASSITHKNVLRIHDLGEADGTRFISMNFVKGKNLKQLLREGGPIPVERAMPLLRQICEALQAAHDAGVVHRDLKPQNILIDQEGTPYIADFGISRSLESGSTMTETGAILGTVDYMSPEQARGDPPDLRSDIYSLGLIMYEIFTGKLPFKSENPLSAMMQRVHKDAPTVRQSRPDLPGWISAVVAKALNRDPEVRHQSARELLGDIERQRPSGKWRRLARPKTWAPLVVVAVLTAAAVIAYRSLPVSGPRMTVPAASMVLLPFQNLTGDAAYDWIGDGIPGLVRSNLMRTKALRLIPDERVQRLLAGLQLTADDLSQVPSVIRIGGLAGAENAITGSLMRAGDQYRIEAKLLRVGAAGGESFQPIRVEGVGEESLFAMADELADRIRDRLGVSEGFWGGGGGTQTSTRSLDALRHYSEGRALLRDGQFTQAEEALKTALEIDQEFPAAHAALAQAYDRLGYDEQALAEADRAVAGLGADSSYEAMKIRAIGLRLKGDRDGAEAVYLELSALAPNDAEAFFDLGLAQEENGNLESALESLDRATDLDPKFADAQFTRGRLLVKLGKSTEALSVFNLVLALHVERSNEEGQAAAHTGLGRTQRVLGQDDEALRNFRRAFEISERLGDRRGVSVALTNMAMTQVVGGLYGEAISLLEDARQISEEIGDQVGLSEDYSNLGDVYVAAGRPEMALKAYQESLRIVREAGNEAILARNFSNIGYTNVVLGRYVEGFFFLKEALQRRREIGDSMEIINSLIDIGIVEQLQGRYDEALKYYLEGQALAERTGERTAGLVFAANLSNIHEDQGNYGAALSLLEEAVATAREINDRQQLAMCLTFLGSVRRKLGDHAGAGEALQEAVDLAREMENAAILSEASLNQGVLLGSLSRQTEAVDVLRQALQAAESSRDYRLQLQANLQEAISRRSTDDLERLVQEAKTAGLEPLLAPGRIARARLLLESGRAEQATEEIEKAKKVAASLSQLDQLFQAYHVSSRILEAQGNREGASLEYAAALEPLEQMRSRLSGPRARHFLGRAETVAFARDAEAIFQASSRPEDVARLRSILQP
ncbi:MAG: tetratricopeptide repeat protein [Acidobacteria bacterium]|nr:tetratricopeptide repeat protein [Acidobacteriota bacterium]